MFFKIVPFDSRQIVDVRRPSRPARLTKMHWMIICSCFAMSVDEVPTSTMSLSISSWHSQNYRERCWLSPRPSFSSISVWLGLEYVSTWAQYSRSRRKFHHLRCPSRSPRESDVLCRSSRWHSFLPVCCQKHRRAAKLRAEYRSFFRDDQSYVLDCRKVLQFKQHLERHILQLLSCPLRQAFLPASCVSSSCQSSNIPSMMLLIRYVAGRPDLHAKVSNILLHVEPLDTTLLEPNLLEQRKSVTHDSPWRLQCSEKKRVRSQSERLCRRQWWTRRTDNMDCQKRTTSRLDDMTAFWNVARLNLFSWQSAVVEVVWTVRDSQKIGVYGICDIHGS